MRKRLMWITVAITVILVGMAGMAGAVPGSLAPEGTVGGAINYQGRLTNPSGAPLNGDYPMRFQVHDDPVANSVLWDSGVVNVYVDHGLFNVRLDVTPDNFDGQELWLRIYVDGEWLFPRQELLPVPYALSLRPGAKILGPPDASGNVLGVEVEGFHLDSKAMWGSNATGTAIRGEATGGYGLLGYSDTNWAVVGQSNTGIAGNFSSNEGYGIRVNADGTDHWDHAGYFTSNMGYGVYGVSMNNYGVRGEGPQAGVQGIGDSIGVSGVSDSGVGVSGWSDTFTGVYGSSNTSNGVYGYSSSWSGVYGSSSTDFGIEGNTSNSSHNYGLYTGDNIYSLNFHSAGAIMHLAQNGGDEPLEPGDVVVFAGVVELEEPGGPLVIQVAKAAQANSPAVAGVVYSRFNIKAVLEGNRPEAGSVHEPLETTIDGPVPAGEYLLLVIQGPVKVKASALAGAIQPGDLLSSTGQTGHAARVDAGAAAPGTVFGKALEALDAGRDQIYVFVTLH